MYAIRKGSAILRQKWNWVVFLKAISLERVFSMEVYQNLGRLSSSIWHMYYRIHEGLIPFKKEFFQNFTKADVKLGGLRKNKGPNAGCDGAGKFMMTARKNMKRS